MDAVRQAAARPAPRRRGARRPPARDLPRTHDLRRTHHALHGKDGSLARRPAGLYPVGSGNSPRRADRGRAMRRWLPYPLLALGLFIMWLLLNQSLAPGHLALGGAIAVLASRSMAPLHPEKPPIRARPIPRLPGIVSASTTRTKDRTGAGGGT